MYVCKLVYPPMRLVAWSSASSRYLNVGMYLSTDKNDKDRAKML